MKFTIHRFQGGILQCILSLVKYLDIMNDSITLFQVSVSENYARDIKNRVIHGHFKIYTFHVGGNLSTADLDNLSVLRLRHMKIDNCPLLEKKSQCVVKVISSIKTLEHPRMEKATFLSPWEVEQVL